MITTILNKLKSVFSKKNLISKTSKTKKASKTTKTLKTPKSSISKKPTKGKKKDVKLLIESFTSIPGIGAKSAQAFYDAGFKSTKDILSAKDEDLLAVPGVGIKVVKKLKDYKP